MDEEGKKEDKEEEEKVLKIAQVIGVADSGVRYQSCVVTDAVWLK